MSERYSKLFALHENLYATGSPVVIAAGALLKDNQTGKVLAQLKLRNIGKKTIKAATVCVEPLDTVGKPLGEPVTYQYLDLHADRDADFGQKAPIALPDSATRSFAVSVVQVIFTDNVIWNADSAEWKPLSRPQPLDALGDSELTKQFRIEYGGGCENLLLEQKDLWHCVCGGVNHQEEANCHKCGKALTELQAIDMEGLRKNKEERVAKERADAEAARIKAKQEAEIAAAKAKKIGKIAAGVTAIVSVAVIAISLLTQVIIPSNKYAKAVSLMDAGQYEEAIAAFDAMDGYKDSVAQISACRAAITEENYNTAVELMGDGQYEEAIDIFAELGEYRDSEAQIDICNAEIHYNIATALLNDGNVVEAYEAFIALDDYKDSTEKANSIYAKYKIEKLKSSDIAVGDYVLFGTFEQDNDESNGAEDIEWIVLEKEGNKIFVISRYGLLTTLYNLTQEDVTWETCYLRQYLNDGFFNVAFSEEEQSMIPTVTVTADKNPKYDTDPGNATQDKIFLLSIEENEQYSPEMCVATEYALMHGVGHGIGSSYCSWWLRSPGLAAYFAAYNSYYTGTIVNYYGNAVRPALWIDLAS